MSRFQTRTLILLSVKETASSLGSVHVKKENRIRLEAWKPYYFNSILDDARQTELNRSHCPRNRNLPFTNQTTSKSHTLNTTEQMALNRTHP